MVSYVPHVREERIVRICLYVCVALPQIVGKLSMAVVLWQPLEHYYYYYLHL